MIDLHLHTTASDGCLTPSQVVAEAQARGVKVIAITDHDTVEGVDEALAAGKELGVRVIPAVEINAELNQEEVHILGYHIDHTLPWLRSYFQEAQRRRAERIWKIAENVRDIHHLPIDLDELKALVGDAVVTRGHLNRYLVDLGAVSSMKEAEEKYTGNHCPSYVPRTTASPQEAIQMIKRAGGLAVMAHPGRIKNPQIITEAIEAGVDGIEAHYYHHSPEQVADYLKLAKEHGLIVTGGTDCHGPRYNSNGSVRIGSVAVPWEVAEALLKITA